MDFSAEMIFDNDVSADFYCSFVAQFQMQVSFAGLDLAQFKTKKLCIGNRRESLMNPGGANLVQFGFAHAR